METNEQMNALSRFHAATHNVILVIQIDGRLFAMDLNIEVELVSVVSERVCVTCAPTICCIKTSFSTW